MNEKFFLKKNLLIGGVFLGTFLLFEVIRVISNYPTIDKEYINSYKDDYKSELKRHQLLERKLKITMQKFNSYHRYMINEDEVIKIRTLISEFVRTIRKLNVANCDPDSVDYAYDNLYINKVNFSLYCTTDKDAQKFLIVFRYFFSPYFNLVDLKQDDFDKTAIKFSIIKRIKR